MGNVFGGDPNCKALLRFEPSNLLVDSICGNTFYQVSSVAVDTVDYWEGAGSGKFTGGYLYAFNASLCSGFPMKNGDAVKKMTVCFWDRQNSSVQFAKAISMWEWAGNKRSWSIQPGSSTYYGGIDWGITDGGHQEWWQFAWKPTNGQVYHYGVTIDGVNKIITVRVFGKTENAVVYADTFTPANPLWVGTPILAIGSEGGGSPALLSNLDEIVIFNDLKSAANIDLIRQGIYGVGAVGPGGLFFANG
jgi:hypothetical protein